MSEVSHSSDESDAEFEEGMSGYKKGGYHPVKIGDVFSNGRYVVEVKLGWGHFSTVWLATDREKKADEKNRLVALKVQKSAKHYFEAGEDEIQLLKCVHNHDNDGEKNVVSLLDSFFHHGPHGKHICMVFEVLGDNMLTWMKRYNYKGLPFSIAKKVARDILVGLSFLHDTCGIIHTDLKPENILFEPFKPVSLDEVKSRFETQVLDKLADDMKNVELSPGNEVKEEKQEQAVLLEPGTSKLTKNQKKKLKLKQKKAAAAVSKPLLPVDHAIIQSLSFDDVFQETPVWRNGYVIPFPEDRNKRFVAKLADLGNSCWVNKHFTDDITTRQYRAPETILGVPYDTSADMFAFACCMFELVTGDYLFDAKDDEVNFDFEQDDDHLALISELIGKAPPALLKKGKHSGKFYNAKGQLRKIKSLDHWSLKDILIEKYRMLEADAKLFSDFLEPMLTWEGSKRATALSMLDHPWLYKDDTAAESAV